MTYNRSWQPFHYALFHFYLYQTELSVLTYSGLALYFLGFRDKAGLATVRTRMHQEFVMQNSGQIVLVNTAMLRSWR